MLSVVVTENGTPKTGLAAGVIYIYDLFDNSLAVNGAAVSEVAKGGYKYNFTTYDNTKDYFVVWDFTGDGLSGDEAYAYQSIDAKNDIAVADILSGIIGIINLDGGKVDIGKINGVAVDGVGTQADPWGPV